MIPVLSCLASIKPRFPVCLQLSRILACIITILRSFNLFLINMAPLMQGGPLLDCSLLMLCCHRCSCFRIAYGHLALQKSRRHTLYVLWLNVVFRISIFFLLQTKQLEWLMMSKINRKQWHSCLAPPCTFPRTLIRITSLVYNFTKAQQERGQS